MARKVLIQIRRGLEKDIGTLAVGELGYCEDTEKLYIGTAKGNVLLVAAQTVGDMLKSIYDTNNDGKVDMAEVADKVPWGGITGKPSTFTPSTHSHNYIDILDTRNTIDTPKNLMAGGRCIKADFKYRTSAGNPPVNACANSTYAHILTIVGWGNSSGGYPVQVTFGKSSIAIRLGMSDTDWGPWTEYRTFTGGLTCNDLKGV
ncbi:hypothetical protein [Alkaliphilus sp. B6464]|uniref:hyaluronate lyase N-terminal domain-containing protein n=1 Tax=Alkaliphilus sp. B6464 TaxID=2731219 RepID=UPI002013A4F8|nr:hypothetical protein [Alkaliphilus sp. B6464]